MTSLVALAGERSWQQWLGQLAAYTCFVLFIGAVANGPVYQHLAADSATIKLSVRHTGQLLGECHQRSAEELAELPPNMRIAADCPRERSPIVLELDLDGELVYSEVLPARGIHNDGRASVYRRITVPAGETRITARLKDYIESEEFQYANSYLADLAPAEILVIDFNEQRSAFDFL